MPEPDEAAKAAEEAAAAKAAEEKAAADLAAAKKDETFTAADRAALQAVVDKERKDRRDADKRAKDAQEKLDAIEAASLSETEKLKKQAEEGKQAAVTATDKLRRANLITALADKGLAGAKAKAAVRLLDDVQYDDADEPTNLDGAITAATAVYGEDVFKASTTPPTNFHGGARTPVPAKGLDELIAEAEAKGDTKTAMSLKSQQLVTLATEAH